MITKLDKLEWSNAVKDILKNWHSKDDLNRSPLVEMRIVAMEMQSDIYGDDPYKKAKALKEVVRRAITALGVDDTTPPKISDRQDLRWSDPRWRPYSILMLLTEHPAGIVAGRVGLALAGRYYEEQKKAVEMLAEVLRNMEGSPISAGSTIGLSYPSGAVKLSDPFYVERNVDMELAEALRRPGETITIRGPRQVGKTSLLTRGVHHGQSQFDARVVYYDLQEGAGEVITESLETFLYGLAVYIFDELELDVSLVKQAWESELPAKRKLSKLIEKHVLSSDDRPILLAMDEIDRLQFTDFHAEFFGLVRSWHNRRAIKSDWNKLSILMAISTEPYLLISDLNQSPFNVGHVLYINDFNPVQIADLNERYGSPVKTDELPSFISLLNGQPYLTRVALYTIVIDKISWRGLEKIATSDQGPFYQHLQLQYRLISRDEKLKEAFRTILHGNQPSDDNANFRLMKAGLITKTNDGDYACRCDLYRRYFMGRL